MKVKLSCDSFHLRRPFSSGDLQQLLLVRPPPALISPAQPSPYSFLLSLWQSLKSMKKQIFKGPERTWETSLAIWHTRNHSLLYRRHFTWVFIMLQYFKNWLYYTSYMGFFPALLRHNWQIRLKIFKAYKVMIWYMSTMWKDSPHWVNLHIHHLTYLLCVVVCVCENI